MNPFSNALIWKIQKDTNYDAYRYSIDINHPIIEYYLSEKLISEKNLRILLELIANNLPISKIIENNDENPSRHDRIYKKEKLSFEEIHQAKKLFTYQCTKMTKAAAISWILCFEPYCYYETQIKKELNES